jgi:hypothetical protein
MKQFINTQVDPMVWWMLTNYILPPAPALNRVRYVLARRADSGILVYVYVKPDMTIVMSDFWYEEVITPQTLAKFANCHYATIEFGNQVLQFNRQSVFFTEPSIVLDCQFI